MQSMTTYDAKEVSTIIDNVVQFGFQDGDMVSFQKIIRILKYKQMLMDNLVLRRTTII